MPTITMDAFHQSVATAPLDLRTTKRDRGGGTATASSSPRGRAVKADSTGHGAGETSMVSPALCPVRREQLTAGSPTPTANPTLELQLDTKHRPTTAEGLKRKAVDRDGLNGHHVVKQERLCRSPLDCSSSEHDAAVFRRTPSDRSSSSSLPFRKRRFPDDPKRSSPLSPPPPPQRSREEDRFKILTPAVQNAAWLQQRSPPRCFEDEERSSAPPPPPWSGVRDGYPAEAAAAAAAAGLVQPYSPYIYPVYYWPHGALHPAQTQEEKLLAEVALATDQDEDGDTPLHIAVVHGKERVVHTLINLLLLGHRDLDIYNNLRQTPLHLAVITQQPGMVEALLRAGADPGALDRNGRTALHLCCEYSQRDCLSVILSHTCANSSCLEIRNYEGLSPLHLAVRGGHKDLARMLLDARADINVMDIKSGQSPLMHAVESANINMVRFLVEQNGCDVNGQSYSGNTALHAACGRGQVDTVRLLLKSGADSSLKNYHNDTPVMVAKNKMITDVLRGKGSKQTRSQDQHCLSNSSQGSNLTASGTPSPNHSIGFGRSPSSTPHSASLSPKGSALTTFAMTF